MFSSNIDFSTKFVYNNDKQWAAFNLIKDDSIRYSIGEWEFLSVENVGSTDSVILRRWS
jgi:hypothetical protein